MTERASKAEAEIDALKAEAQRLTEQYEDTIRKHRACLETLRDEIGLITAMIEALTNSDPKPDTSGGRQ